MLPNKLLVPMLQDAEQEFRHRQDRGFIHMTYTDEGRRVAGWLERVRYLGVAFRVLEEPGRPVQIQAKARTLDSYDLTTVGSFGQVMTPRGEVLLREEDFFRWLLGAMERWAVHEARELFRVDGKIYDNPHQTG